MPIVRIINREAEDQFSLVAAYALNGCFVLLGKRKYFLQKSAFLAYFYIFASLAVFKKPFQFFNCQAILEFTWSNLDGNYYRVSTNVHTYPPLIFINIWVASFQFVI
jgi:hypothetical protein